MAFQWSLAALETLMAEDQMDQMVNSQTRQMLDTRNFCRNALRFVRL